VTRGYPVITDEPVDLVSDDGGLAAPGPGQNQQGAIDVLYRRFLWRVQFRQFR
jgi:hypothetical protein